MAVQKKISRRAFFAITLLPALSEAKPLIDFGQGLGLFSNQENPISRNNFNGLALHNDPEPELDNFNQLKSNDFSRIVIEKKFNLKLINANTKDAVTFQFGKNHRLRSQEISKLNHFLKDWRTNEIKKFDTMVLNDFLKICSLCSGRGDAVKVSVHSGFRSKETNEYLRRKSHKVARNSMHILGKAIDFSIPGMSVQHLTKIVKANTKGGVGSYPTFVHLDSGPQRSWS
ncbi:DUF882 domain-containing protein [uncultured Planktomarina sp.]|jgi:uncharacterized protein YcbK (DUF882 family)|uniref:YcbK family protein n=1 Tax=uncultured Planktomarina sp. TaxID=1538529 RepID=UPI00326107DF